MTSARRKSRKGKQRRRGTQHENSMRRAKPSPAQARPPSQRALRVRQFWLVLVCCAGLLTLFYDPPAFIGISDSRLNLLTGRAIVEHGTIKLDAYRDELARNHIGLSGTPGGHTALVEKNGHLYNVFPPGPALLSLPLAAVCAIFDIDVLSRGPGEKPQSVGAALTCVWVFLMLYLLARLYLARSVALFAALAFLTGTSLSSVLGVVMGGHNFVAPLALTVLYLLAKALDNRSLSPHFGVLIGVLLFLAYLCRPTAVLLAPPVFIVLYLLDKPSAYKAVAASVLSGLLFIGFSFYEYGQWLPDYYLPQRLGGSNYWVTLYGLLLSPARGLLIFTPVLLLLMFPPGGWRKAVAGREILLPLLLWPVSHILVVASFPHWWGGWSYGPRFMVDILPAAYLFLLLYLKQLTDISRGLFKAVHIALLPVVAAASIAIHTYQGVYTNAWGYWNVFPNVDEHPELLFDWKYPQFLHTHKRQQRRAEEYRALMSPEQIEQYNAMRPK